MGSEQKSKMLNSTRKEKKNVKKKKKKIKKKKKNQKKKNNAHHVAMRDTDEVSKKSCPIKCIFDIVL